MGKIISLFRVIFQKNSSLELKQWRRKNFVFILLVTLVSSLPAFLVSSFKAVEEGSFLCLAAFVAIYFLAVWLMLSRVLSFSVRAWLSVILFTFLGVQSFVSLGPVGSVRVWFFSTAAFTTLVLGVKAGLRVLLFQIVLLMFLGYLLDAGSLSLRIGQDFSLYIWGVTTVTFGSLCLAAVVIMGRLTVDISYALNDSRKKRKQLKKEIKSHRKSLVSLQESEAQWIFVMESGGDGLWDWDVASDIFSYSPSCKAMLGYEASELEGDLIKRWTFVHPEDRDSLRQVVMDLQAGKRSSYRAKYRVLAKDGRHIWVYDRARVMDSDDSGRPLRVIGIYTDITLLKSMEEEKNELQARLNQSQKMESIGTLAGGIAHDFNNLLSAIMGYAELARAKTERNCHIKRDIDQILKASQQAAELVQQILMFSRKGVYKKTPVDLQRIVREAFKMLRFSLPSTIEIREKYMDDRTLVLADPTSIQQVVLNLCTNALQAMNNQKGVLEVGLSHEQVSSRDAVGDMEVRPGFYSVLRIEDNGPGIAEDIMEYIFEPYFTTKAQGEGTGLGLATVHGIVKDCGGFITVESEQGQGTVFKVYFPELYKNSEDDMLDLVDRTVLQVMGVGRESILLVDDEKSLCEVGKIQLEKLGYKVTAMSDSVEALKLFEADPEQFDLVISDQTMPGLTGAEFAAQIFELCPGFPFILYSGYSSVINRKEALAMGISAFLQKPITAAKLSDQVRIVLDENSNR